MKTLYVNGRYLSQATTGVQRYAREVVAAWDADLDEGRIDPSKYRIEVIAPRNLLKMPEYRHVHVERCSTSGRLWEQIELPLRTKNGLLFSPYAAAPLMKLNHAVTIHDAGVRATPQQYSKGFRIYYSAVYWILGRTCRRLFTVSDFSKKELHQYFKIPLNKLIVVYPGCDHLNAIVPDPSILTKANIQSGRFVLGVSSRSPIKNFEGLIKAWDLLSDKGFELVIAGKSNERIFQQAGVDGSSGVKWLGYVSDQELRTLYSAAALFVYPSFYEGFGLPPLEAMGCGCPVVVANSSALPESCGDGAIYCDPFCPTDIASKISKIIEQPELAETLRSLGRKRANQFKIQKTASILWGELKKLL